MKPSCFHAGATDYEHPSLKLPLLWIYGGLGNFSLFPLNIRSAQGALEKHNPACLTA